MYWRYWRFFNNDINNKLLVNKTVLCQSMATFFVHSTTQYSVYVCMCVCGCVTILIICSQVHGVHEYYHGKYRTATVQLYHRQLVSFTVYSHLGDVPHQTAINFCWKRQTFTVHVNIFIMYMYVCMYVCIKYMYVYMYLYNMYIWYHCYGTTGRRYLCVRVCVMVGTL